MVLALIPRLLWAFAFHPAPFSDMRDYYLCAVNFLKGSHLAMSADRLAYRPPLYPLFLAGWLQCFPNGGLTAVRIIQSALDSFTPVLLFYISRMVLSSWQLDVQWKGILTNGVSFFMALTYSWFADTIFFSSLLMTETVFLFFLLLWTMIGLRTSQTRNYRMVCGFSFLLGILALIRPSSLFFLPIVVYKSLECIPRVRWRRNLWVPFFAWLLPILPWTIRNLLVLHAFVLISANSGINLYLGHNPRYDYYPTGEKELIRQFYKEKFGMDEVGEDRFFSRLAMDYIMHHPLSLIPHSLMKLYFLYIIEKEPWPWEEYNRGEGLRFAGGILWPVLSWNPFFLCLALAGIVYAGIRKLPHALFLSVLGLQTVACLVFFANTRFRMPLEPYLWFYTILGILSFGDTGIRIFRFLSFRYLFPDAR